MGRIETSVALSLAELRNIEKGRVEAERAAEAEARRQAAQAAREAELAREMFARAAQEESRRAEAEARQREIDEARERRLLAQVAARKARVEAEVAGEAARVREDVMLVAARRAHTRVRHGLGVVAALISAALMLAALAVGWDERGLTAETSVSVLRAKGDQIGRETESVAAQLRAARLLAMGLGARAVEDASAVVIAMAPKARPSRRPPVVRPPETNIGRMPIVVCPKNKPLCEEHEKVPIGSL